MEEYYVKTVTNAFHKLGPLVAYGLAGYFIFFKLPFLLALKNLKDAKKDLNPEAPVPAKKDESYSVRDYERFVHQKRRLEQSRPEPKKEQLQLPSPDTKTARTESPEMIFELKPGQKVTKDELKKKHRELLKQNHPDLVEKLSPEFKALADRKTKAINEAYEKLLKKAS